MSPTKPEDLFRAEKERALTVRNSQHARLLAEAKAAFDKLMAEGQAARKSGRPRKHPLPPLKTSPSTRPLLKPGTPAPIALLAAPAPAAAAPIAKAAPPKPVKSQKAEVHPAPKRQARAKKSKAAARLKPKGRQSRKR